LSILLFVPLLFAADKPQLIVAAASDLAPIENQLASNLSTVCGCVVRFATGSSGLLARQIRNGAPFDLFLSANDAYVKELSTDGHLLAATVRVYARGRLALWSPKGSIRRLEDLAGSGISRIAIANPVHAPYGVAARQALERAGLWRRLESRMVLGENVRQALQFAESGNVDAALVSWSLVLNRGGVLVPESVHSAILQSGAVTTVSRHRALGSCILEFLTGPGGRRVLEQAGFGAP